MNQKQLFVAGALVAAMIASNAFAISVSKLVMVSTEKDSKEITVYNEAEYPAFVAIELSELKLSELKEVKLDEEDFENWPIFLDKKEVIIDPKSSINLKVNDLAALLEQRKPVDRVVGISFIPKSYKGGEAGQNSLNLLTGYKTWYVIPNDNEKVKGTVSVVGKGEGKFLLINNTDTAIKFDVDVCEGKEKTESCTGSVMVLSGRNKEIDFDNNKYKGKQLVLEARDYRGRFDKSFKLKLK